VAQGPKPNETKQTKSPKFAVKSEKTEQDDEGKRFEAELHAALEALHCKRDTRRLTGILISNQDAEFPADQITDAFAWKGDNTAQNAVYLGIQQQYLFWKHTWSQHDDDQQLDEGLPTFNFHLMAMLAVAMDTYWFSDNQQLQIFDWLRDMVSGAELEPLKLENQRVGAENMSCKKRLYELEDKLTTLKKMEKDRTGGGQSNNLMIVIVVLLAMAVTHILTLHLK